MARELLAQESVDGTLERITASATDLVDGCDAAGVLVVRGRRVETLAPTDQVSVVSDRLQEQLGEGPCFDALVRDNGERVFRIRDLSVEERWPASTPQARQIGVGSMMGFLLFTDEETLGALNLYSRTPGAFTRDSETAGWLLAAHAAVAYSNARTQDQPEEAVATRHPPPATRHPIGEAMGILMGRHRITDDQAFAALRRSSQQHNIKLREVARRVCADGSLPRPRQAASPARD